MLCDHQFFLKLEMFLLVNSIILRKYHIDRDYKYLSYRRRKQGGEGAVAPLIFGLTLISAWKARLE